MENFEHLIDWYQRHKFKRNFDQESGQYQEILSLTSFLDSEYSEININQRIWHLKNQNFEIQRCKVCGKTLKWDNNHRKYPNTCNQLCNGKYMKSKQYVVEFRSDMIERYGQDSYSKTEEFKENFEHLIDWYQKHKFDGFNHKHYEYRKILYLTSFLDGHYQKISTAQRMWHILNNNFEIQKCRICGNIVSWQRKQSKYVLTCGKNCYSRYFKTNEFKTKAEKTNLKKYGIEYSSQLQKTKDKAKKTCLERYGTLWYQQTRQAKISQTARSGFYTMLQQGIGNAIYVENLGDGNHLLECKLCGQRFEYNTYVHGGGRFGTTITLCPVCNPTQKFHSSAEKELLSFISSIYPGPIQENTKSVIPPYELDIFIPELSLAFEYNGLYWHSDLQKPDDYHKIKTEMCESKGIRLVHVFEDDWNFKQEIIKSIISNIISPRQNTTIPARKCQIFETSLQTACEFLEQNHIQGSVLVQTCCYGLYYGRKLVSLMSFKKSDSGFELQRYGIKLGHTIVGGAEKLWSHFLKNHDPEFVITYADISLFTGKVYQKLGFTKVRRNKPNYMFVDGDVRIPKQSIRKLGQGYKRENDPYPRIYNCGIDKWQWKN